MIAVNPRPPAVLVEIVWAMAVISFLLVFMQQGSIQVASQFGLNENASDIITGILLFFLIGCEFFINYKLEFRKKGEK